MNKGDIIQIDGTLGFLLNPKMEVLGIKPGMVLLASVDAKSGGLLSHMSESRHGVDLIKKKLRTQNDTN